MLDVPVYSFYSLNQPFSTGSYSCFLRKTKKISYRDLSTEKIEISHKGVSIGEVINNNIEYVDWILNCYPHIYLDKSIVNILSKKGIYVHPSSLIDENDNKMSIENQLGHYDEYGVYIYHQRYDKNNSDNPNDWTFSRTVSYEEFLKLLNPNGDYTPNLEDRVTSIIYENYLPGYKKDYEGLITFESGLIDIDTNRSEIQTDKHDYIVFDQNGNYKSWKNEEK